jgi:hypothetical protein
MRYGFVGRGAISVPGGAGTHRIRPDGHPREQVSVAGRGEREPIVPTEDEVAEPRNRRVEITVR